MGRDLLISTYVSPTDDAKLLRVLNAALLYCAALLVPVVPRIKSETRGQDESYTRDTIDVEERQRELFAQAEAEIAPNLPTTVIGQIVAPVLFTTAPGYRGR